MYSHNRDAMYTNLWPEDGATREDGDSEFYVSNANMSGSGRVMLLLHDTEGLAWKL